MPDSNDTIRIPFAKFCRVCGQLIGAGEFGNHLADDHPDALRDRGFDPEDARGKDLGVSIPREVFEDD